MENPIKMDDLGVPLWLRKPPNGDIVDSWWFTVHPWWFYFFLEITWLTEDLWSNPYGDSNLPTSTRWCPSYKLVYKAHEYYSIIVIYSEISSINPTYCSYKPHQLSVHELGHHLVELLQLAFGTQKWLVTFENLSSSPPTWSKSWSEMTVLFGKSSEIIYTLCNMGNHQKHICRLQGGAP